MQMGDLSAHHCYDRPVSRGARTTPEGKRPRFITIAVWVCLGLFLLWCAAMLRLIVYPIALASPDSVDSVDAVYVLGLASEERLARGVGLIEDEMSDQLVVTVTADNMLHQFCSTDHAYEVYCVSPDPVTTRGEARQWGQLAEQQQWESVMIVTTRSHATRAKLYFERCFTGQIVVVNDEVQTFSAEQWVEQFVYETGAMLKFAVSQGC